MTARSGPSGGPDRAFLMAPLVAYPNPHAQSGEEEDGHYEWRPEVTVQKTWRQDELKNISKELSDPIKDSVEFRDQMEKLVRLQAAMAGYCIHHTRQDETALGRRPRGIQ
ncbi:hypothetical protein DPEC_G00171090 [Dallia pectoralis]|uniref:Uncharacterized protein n=2 Tax=Dallia pectoralis TaxID=75939 RepID=A0ACC2GD31_DALPE|nr:hypothetical protein DPEC_G00171080 [Dallia pectoralis]KAJ8001594.1 hypothetical protein DPEC_G00171090 [Dallia pectoralis]